MSEDPHHKVLNDCLKIATIENDWSDVPSEIAEYVDSLASSTHASPFTVLLTSLIKKSVSPEQDVRLHQAQLSGGYSGRGLDTKIITPFLEANRFPHMKESGWLTRSFEQSFPYNLDYPGNISGKGIKNAFLKTLDAVENNDVGPKTLATYLLWKLIQRRDKENVSLSKPTNMTISQTVSCLEEHFLTGGHGKARLPVLAIYAVYQKMVGGGFVNRGSIKIQKYYIAKSRITHFCRF